MTKADTNYVKAIEELSLFLTEITPESSDLSVSEFESLYKELRAMQRFWDTTKWDVIEKESGDVLVKEARSDDCFKKYYKLRTEIDRLEVLVK